MVSIYEGVSIALGIVVLVLYLSIGATITNDFSGELTGTAQDAVKNGTEGLANISKRVPLVGTVFGFALVLGIIGLLGMAGYAGYQKMR